MGSGDGWNAVWMWWPLLIVLVTAAMLMTRLQKASTDPFVKYGLTRPVFMVPVDEEVNKYRINAVSVGEMESSDGVVVTVVFEKIGCSDDPSKTPSEHVSGQFVIQKDTKSIAFDGSFSGEQSVETHIPIALRRTVPIS